MSKNLFRKCPVCSWSNVEFLHHQNFTLLDAAKFLPSSYDVVCCKKCGFVYANTSADQSDYDKYYTELSKYEDDKTATGGGCSAQDMERIKVTVDDICEVVDNKKSSILDIGCANGGVLKLLLDRGYSKTFGLDPSPSCVNNIKEKSIESFLGGLFDIPKEIKGRKFDCIILTHVLEHVRDLKLAIDTIASLLNKDGFLYIEVPNAGEYQNNFVVPFYYFDCEHINHFDENALKNLCVPYGLNFHKSVKKMMKLTDSSAYPALGVFFKKQINKDYHMEKSKVKKSVNEYIKLSKENDCDKLIRLFSQSQEKVVVWGAGSFTQRLLKDSDLGNCNVVAYIDNDSVKQGHKINGVTIFGPESLIKNPYPVLICSAFHSMEIAQDIKNRGFKNKIILVSKIK